MFGSLGQDPPRKVGLPKHVADPLLQAKYTAEQKAWCMDAVAHGLYPGAGACNRAIAAGAPMTDLMTAQPGSEAAYSNTKLYVGLGIAALVAFGVGAYLITR